MSLRYSFGGKAENSRPNLFTKLQLEASVHVDVVNSSVNSRETLLDPEDIRNLSFENVRHPQLRGEHIHTTVEKFLLPALLRDKFLLSVCALEVISPLSCLDHKYLLYYSLSWRTSKSKCAGLYLLLNLAVRTFYSFESTRSEFTSAIGLLKLQGSFLLVVSRCWPWQSYSQA